MMKDFQLPIKPLFAILMLGIVISIFLNIYTREVSKLDEGYTELYLNDNKEVPKQMKIGNSYNISFGFTNHELMETQYNYEAESDALKYTGNVSLEPGESATITLILRPITNSYNFTLDVRTNRTSALTNSTVTIASFDVNGFGKILHQNLSIEELEVKPFRQFKEETLNGEKTFEHTSINTTLSSKNGTIYTQTIGDEEHSTIIARPFTIKLYKLGGKKDDPQEIHFWYELN